MAKVKGTNRRTRPQTKLEKIVLINYPNLLSSF